MMSFIPRIYPQLSSSLRYFKVISAGLLSLYVHFFTDCIKMLHSVLLEWLERLDIQVVAPIIYCYKTSEEVEYQGPGKYI